MNRLNNKYESSILIPGLYYHIGAMLKEKASDDNIYAIIGFLANDKITENGFEGEYYIEPRHKYTYSESHSVKYFDRLVAEIHLNQLIEFGYLNDILDKYNLEVIGYVINGNGAYNVTIDIVSIDEILKKYPNYDISPLYIFGKDILYRTQDSIWYEAEHADEKPMYYKVYKQMYKYPPLSNDYYYSSTFIIKRYKPSLAKIVIKRTGCKMIPIEMNKVYTKDSI